MNLYPEPGCSCATPAALLHAALTEADMELCPVHQADELAALEATAKADKARGEGDRVRSVLDEVRAADELAARRQAKAERDAEIDAIEDPLVRSLTLITRREDLPLGLPPTAYGSLAGFRNDDGPDAA